jgi:hypothetical protein
MINYSPIPVVKLPIGYWIILLLFIIIYIKKSREKVRVIYYDFPILNWILICLLSLATIYQWTNYKDAIAGIVQNVIVPAIIYILINNKEIINDDECKFVLKKIFPLLLIFIVIQSLFAFLKGYAIGSSTSIGQNIMKYHGFDIGWAKSNYLAGILVFLIPFTYFQKNKTEESWVKQIILWGSLLLGAVIALATLSRGAILTFMVIISSYISGTLLFRKKIKIYPIMFSLGGLISLMMPFISKLWSRFINMKFDFSFLSRLYMWNDCINQIKNNIVLGVGFRQYLFNSYFLKMDDPHNIFLKYGVELGGFGIILILLILFYPIYGLFIKRNYFKNNIKLYFIFIPVYIGAIFHSQLEVIITAARYGMMFWVFYAIFIRAVRDMSNNNKWWI